MKQKRMTKRILSAMLAMQMLAGSLSGSVYAEEPTPPEKPAGVSEELPAETEEPTEKTDREDPEPAGESETAVEEEPQPSVTPVTEPAFEQTAELDDMTITVRAEAGAFPDGAKLAADRIADSQTVQAEAAVEEVRDSSRSVAVSYTFDIRILDAEGNEVEPDGRVDVIFGMKEVRDENLSADIYHIVEEESEQLSAEKLAALEGEEDVTVNAESFSLYTVEFTYESRTYTLQGDHAVPLQDILDSLELRGEPESVEVSNDSLVGAVNHGEGWMIHAREAFDTEEWMKVKLNGITYEITLTDTQLALSANAHRYQITIYPKETYLSEYDGYTFNAENKSGGVLYYYSFANLTGAREYKRLISVEEEPAKISFLVRFKDANHDWQELRFETDFRVCTHAEATGTWLNGEQVLFCEYSIDELDVLNYVDENGEEKTCTEFTTLAPSTRELTSGWYAANHPTVDPEASERIRVTGDAKIILKNGCAFTASQGFIIEDGAVLTIYGQNGWTGRLYAQGKKRHAGITVTSGGKLIVNGGNIYAYGDKHAAGIGTDESAGSVNVGEIVINNGNLYASGGNYGAGIGGGKNGSLVKLTVNNGTINAVGGHRAAGIGGGHSGNGGEILIRNGTVKATGGFSAAGIGGGNNGTNGPITIENGYVEAIACEGEEPYDPMHNSGAAIGAGADRDQGGAVTISGGSVHAVSYGFGAGIGAGGHETHGHSASEINISGGTVTAMSLNGAGIGGSGGGNGVKQGVTPYGAGGGCGTVTISGGQVTAWSVLGGAGIGGGNKGGGGTVNISGGTVAASGGYMDYKFIEDILKDLDMDGPEIDTISRYMDNLFYEMIANIVLKWFFNRELIGTGIGGGNEGAGVYLNITGGTVIATSRYKGIPAIGGGKGTSASQQGTVTLADGLQVYAGSSRAGEAEFDVYQVEEDQRVAQCTASNPDTARYIRIQAGEPVRHNLSVRYDLNHEKEYPEKISVYLQNRSHSASDHGKWELAPANDWKQTVQVTSSCNIALSCDMGKEWSAASWKIGSVSLPADPANPAGALLNLSSQADSGLSEADYKTVREAVMSGTAEIMITAAHTRNFSVQTAWNYAEVSIAKPQSLSVVLQHLESGKWKTADTLTLTESNQWKGSFKPAAFDALENYRIREVNNNGSVVHAKNDADGDRSDPILNVIAEGGVKVLKDFKVTYEADSDGSMAITNTEISDAPKSLSGMIVWNDQNDVGGERPDSARVHLIANETIIASAKASADTNWMYSFENIPPAVAASARGSGGYTVVQENVPGYLSHVSATTITNTYPEMVRIQGKVTWPEGDQSHPAQVPVYLMSNGSIIAETVASQGSSWNYEFPAQPKKDSGGTVITYAVTPKNIENYDSSVSASGDTITYTMDDTPYSEDKRNLTVTIKWDDSSDVDDMRPDDVVVYLIADDEIADCVDVMAEDDSSTDEWQYTFENLPTKDGDTVIEYSVIGEEVDAYTDSVNAENHTITYTLDPLEGVTSLSGTVAWAGDAERTEARPDFVAVYILGETTAGTELMDVAIAEEKKNWSWSIEDLPANDDVSGEAIQYRAVQEAVSGYRTDTEAGEGTITITNTFVELPAEDAEYTVKYFYQKDGSYAAEADESAVRTGEIGSGVFISSQDRTPQKTGYMFDESAGDTLYGTVAEDDSLVLTVHFAEECSLTFDPSGGAWSDHTGILTLSAARGSVISIPKAPARSGYTFVEWNGSSYQPGDSYTVSGDHSFKAIWKENGRDDPTPSPSPTPKPTPKPTPSASPAASPSSSSSSDRKAKTPNTSDPIHPERWGILLVTSLLGAVCISRRLRKEEES